MIIYYLAPCDTRFAAKLFSSYLLWTLRHPSEQKPKCEHQLHNQLKLSGKRKDIPEFVFIYSFIHSFILIFIQDAKLTNGVFQGAGGPIVNI